MQSTNKIGIHPNPLDRNKSILWARYLFDSTDWLLLAPKVTDLSLTGNGESKLVSFAVLTPDGKTVFECLLKSEEMLTSKLLAEHGLDYAVVFNAMTFPEIAERLRQLTAGKQILTYNLSGLQDLLDELCARYGVTPVILSGHSMKSELARFVGESDGRGHYRAQPLKASGSAASECRELLSALYEIASSSQTINTAPTGNQGWTAQFYKPKISTKEKIKDFLGM